MTFNPDQPQSNQPMTRRQLRELERLREEQLAEQERLRAGEQGSSEQAAPVTPRTDVTPRTEQSDLPEGVELTSEVTESPLGGSIFSSTQRPYMPSQYSDYLSDPPKLVSPPPATPDENAFQPEASAPTQEPEADSLDENEITDENELGGRRSSYLPAEETIDQGKLDAIDQ